MFIKNLLLFVIEIVQKDMCHATKNELYKHYANWTKRIIYSTSFLHLEQKLM